MFLRGSADISAPHPIGLLWLALEPRSPASPPRALASRILRPFSSLLSLVRRTSTPFPPLARLSLRQGLVQFMSSSSHGVSLCASVDDNVLPFCAPSAASYVALKQHNDPVWFPYSDRYYHDSLQTVCICNSEVVSSCIREQPQAVRGLINSRSNRGKIGYCSIKSLHSCNELRGAAESGVDATQDPALLPILVVLVYV
ncbi:hypothetical protein BDR04DRAFT_1161310 [Suillus decipiens]|nr:hypothetical protein BDR04DRAFT_1161310 [Suillus decipiens]